MNFGPPVQTLGKEGGGCWGSQTRSGKHLVARISCLLTTSQAHRRAEYHLRSLIQTWFLCPSCVNDVPHRNVQASVTACTGARTTRSAATRATTAPWSGFWASLVWCCWPWAGRPSVRCGCTITWTDCTRTTTSQSCEDVFKC